MAGTQRSGCCLFGVGAGPSPPLVAGDFLILESLRGAHQVAAKLRTRSAAGRDEAEASLRLG